MHRIILIPVLLVLFNTLATFAQMTKEEYTAKMESLNLQKKGLKSEIESLIIETDSLQKIVAELEQEMIKEFRELYILKYGEEIGNRIAYKRIWKGMTDEMVRDGWGEPDRIEKNIEAWGVFTQWMYGDVIFFFRDGKLTDWEEGRIK
jgi:cell division protein FtsB